MPDAHCCDALSRGAPCRERLAAESHFTDSRCYLAGATTTGVTARLGFPTISSRARRLRNSGVAPQAGLPRRLDLAEKLREHGLPGTTEVSIKSQTPSRHIRCDVPAGYFGGPGEGGAAAGGFVGCCTDCTLGEVDGALALSKDTGPSSQKGRVPMSFFIFTDTGPSILGNCAPAAPVGPVPTGHLSNSFQ